MKFVAVDTPAEYGTLYRSTIWDIRLHQAGFEIPVATVYKRNKLVMRIVGKLALDDAIAWIRRQPGPVAELEAKIERGARAHTEAA